MTINSLVLSNMADDSDNIKLLSKRANPPQILGVDHHSANSADESTSARARQSVNLQMLKARFRQIRPPQPEVRKIVLKKPLEQFLVSSIVHLIPVSVCIYLLYLDFSRYYWYLEPRTGTTNALQFAAKVQELFILASLSAMALHHARRHLLGTGLPLGLVSASYRVSDILVLKEKSFWCALYNNRARKLGLFIAAGALFSVLVGPSTAVALLPTQGFSPWPDAFANSTARLLLVDSAYFIDASAPVHNRFWPDPQNLKFTWPLHLFGERFASCDFQNCANGMFENVFQWYYDQPTGQPTIINEKSSNFMYPAISTTVKGSARDGAAIAAGSTSSIVIAHNLGMLWRATTKAEIHDLNLGPLMNNTRTRFRSSQADTTYQPILQTRCQWHGDSQKLESSEVRLKADGLLSHNRDQGWHMEAGTSWPVPTESLNKLTKPGADGHVPGEIEWIEAGNVGAEGRFSIAALIPSLLNEGEWNELEWADRKKKMLISSCVFNAHWVPGSFVFDPNSRSGVHMETNWTSSSNPLASAVQGAQQSSSGRINLPPPLGLIEIGMDWAKLFQGGGEARFTHTINNQMMMGDPQDPFLTDLPFSNSSQTDPVVLRFISRLTRPLTNLMLVGLSHLGSGTGYLVGTKDTSTLALLDGFAVSGVDDTVFFAPEIINSSLDQVFQTGIEVDRYGFAYGARTQTTLFARSILIIHLALFMLYVLYALWDQLHAHKYTVSRWTNWQDLMLLVWNSNPPGSELENCGAGAQRSRTWRKNVRIRADENERLEMVFGSRSKGLMRLRPKVKYA